MRERDRQISTFCLPLNSHRLRKLVYFVWYTDKPIALWLLQVSLLAALVIFQ